jgi:hypothetical protein
VKSFLVNHIGDAIFRQATHRFNGLQTFSRHCITAFNLQPSYKISGYRGNLTSLTNMRERLNNEAGLVISNHPSDIDALLILSLLKRPVSEIKILASELYCPLYRKHFGKALFLPARKSSITEMLQHIRNGGLGVHVPFRWR